MSNAPFIRIAGLFLSPGHNFFGHHVLGRGGLRTRILTSGTLRVDA